MTNNTTDHTGELEVKYEVALYQDSQIATSTDSEVNTTKRDIDNTPDKTSYDNTGNNPSPNEDGNSPDKSNEDNNETHEKTLEPNTYSFRRMKHISHLDLDGYSSTIISEVLQKYLPENYMYLETENILPNRLNGIVAELIQHLDDWDIVVITDLAINKDLLEMITTCSNPEKFRIFDHHECDLENLPENIIVTKVSPFFPDKLSCATELYYNFIINDPIFDLIKISGLPNALRYFVECVRVYDTYEFWATRNDNECEQYETYVDAPRLNTLFHILEREDFKEYCYEYLINRGFALTRSSPSYPFVGEILKLESNKNKRYVDAALRRLIRTDFNCTVYRQNDVHNLNYHIGVVFAEKNGPVIGNTACELNDDIDFCAVVSNNQVSLYTNRPNINVSDIAKIFGGGGHAEAAGLTIPYINANVYNLRHFFSIIECAGRLTPGQFEHIVHDMTDTN